ncbi:MAG: N-acetyltransferase [Verrucomicrobiales bacterium]
MIRPADELDHSEIHGVLNTAFHPSRFESCLFEAAKSSDVDHADWVAEEDGRVVGYILYTPAYKEGEPIGFHLGPHAVHPDFQKQGIGADLIATTLQVPPIRSSSVFVFGEPGLYERFGFSEVATAHCPYDPGNDHFRALRWSEASKSFTIGYSKIFEEAERHLADGRTLD